MITRFTRCAQPAFVVAFILSLGVTACVQAQATKPPVPGIKWSTLSSNPKPTISASSPGQPRTSTSTLASAPTGPSTSTAAQPSITTAQPKGAISPLTAPAVQSTGTGVLTGGRRICGSLERLVQPYCSIGMITNVQARQSWGTGTLIGTRYVLTAAHVIERVDATEKSGGGNAVFVLPAQGQESRIVRAELDAGWKHKLLSFDIAVCALEKPVSTTLGHVDWGVFEEEFFDASLNLTGYDTDASSPRDAHPLVTRQGEIGKMIFHQGEYAAKGAGIGMGVGAIMDGGVDWFYPTKPKTWQDKVLMRPNKFIVGLAGAAYGSLAGHVIDREGWASWSIRVVNGVEGGPIWMQTPNGPLVVGVQTVINPFYTDMPSGLMTSRLGQWPTAGGSRITAGPCQSMIQDFIGAGSAGSQ